MKAIAILDWLSVCIYLKIKTEPERKNILQMYAPFRNLCWDNQVNQSIQQTTDIFPPEFIFPCVTQGSGPNLPRKGYDYEIGA